MRHLTPVTRAMAETSAIHSARDIAIALDHDYAVLQEEYLCDVHLPNYDHSREAWHRTLYQPLQRFVSAVIDKYIPQRPLHLCYVGPGPHAPLFAEALLRTPLLARINRITLVDICPSALARCQYILRELAPQMTIGSLRHDVTAGMGIEFLAVLQNIAHSTSPQTSIAANMARLAQTELRTPILPAINADLVYSEMLATSTTTAPMLAFELDLARRGDRTSGATVQATQQLWQQYNEALYAQQLAQYAALAAPDGTIAIAADIAKIFYDATQPTMTSFCAPHFPNIESPHLLHAPFQLHEEVCWIDQPPDEAPHVRDIDALQPHCHHIGFDVYKRI